MKLASVDHHLCVADVLAVCSHDSGQGGQGEGVGATGVGTRPAAGAVKDRRRGMRWGGGGKNWNEGKAEISQM